MRRDSFERFYMEKVALGEGCGCAEMAINLRDAEATGGSGSHSPHRGGAASPAARWVARAHRALRIFRRRSRRGA